MRGYVWGVREGCYNLKSEVARNKFMTTLEQELIEKISRLDENQQRRVLEFIKMLEREDDAKQGNATQDLKQQPQEDSSGGNSEN